MLFQPPPTPAHVLRSLEYIAAHPHQEQKYAHVQAGSAHISAYSNAGHSQTQAYTGGQAQAYNAEHAQAYSGGHAQTYNAGHVQAYSAGHTPYHHYKWKTISFWLIISLLDTKSQKKHKKT